MFAGSVAVRPLEWQMVIDVSRVPDLSAFRIDTFWRWMHQVRSKRWYLAVKLYRVTCYNSLLSPHQPTIRISKKEGWRTEKLKQSHYSPEHTLRVPEGWGSQISRQSSHEGGEVVSPKHLPHLSPRKYPWYSFLLEAESTPDQQCARKDYVNEKLQWHHRG